jgi:hypothetical protein
MMRARSIESMAGVLSLWLGSCSSPSTPPGNDDAGGTDATPLGALADADADATAPTRRPNVGPCAKSIDAFCASNPTTCVLDWSSAQDPSQWCALLGPVTTGGPRLGLFANCDGSNIAAIGYGTSGIAYYIYDAVTSRLVRVELDSKARADCLAGEVGPAASLATCLDGGYPSPSCASDAAAD